MGYNRCLSVTCHEMRERDPVIPPGRDPADSRFHPSTGAPMMKSRLFALLTALTLAVTLAGCGDSAKQSADKAAAATKEAADKSAAATKEAADKAAAATKEAADKASDATKDAAAKAADATKDAAAKAADSMAPKK
jgi:hypothetical protein